MLHSKQNYAPPLGALTLIRHAHTIWNGPPKRFQGRADVGLSEKGLKQCRDAGEQFSWVKRIVASPARRVQETIQYLFEGRDVPNITLDSNLWEIDNGWYSGKFAHEIEDIDLENFQLWNTRPGEVRPGNGESLLDMLCRAATALKRFETFPSDGTLVVTHGGIIRTLTLALNQMSLNDFHQLEVNNLHCFSLTQESRKFLSFHTSKVE